MAKRKVDEALEVMQDSLWEWSKAARKVIRYGNLYDFEELEEQLTEAVRLAQRLAAKRMDDSVQRRHQREIDRVYVEALSMRDSVKEGRQRKFDDMVIDGLIRDSQSS